MNPRRAAAVLLVGIAFGAAAQERRDPAAVMAAQREAMAALAFMDGVWRGPATTVLPSSDKHAITQTERIGPLLGGTVKGIDVGDRIAPGKDPVRFFEMKLTRVGDSEWPGAGAIPLR